MGIGRKRPHEKVEEGKGQFHNLKVSFLHAEGSFGLMRGMKDVTSSSFN